MTNREIRLAARKKKAAKGLTPVLFLAYVPSIVLNIYNNLDKLGVSFQIHWTMWYVIQFVIILFSYAGGARVSVAAWERGEARVHDLVAYFSHGRLFLRALIVMVITIGLSWGGAYILLCLAMWMKTTSMLWLLYPLTFLLSIFILSLNYLYFAIELEKGKPLWRTIFFGIGKICKNFFRIVGMAIALWWWVVLVTAIVVGIAYYNLPHIGAISILTVFLTVAYWFLGPYFRISAAGLAIEIFRGKNAARDDEAEEEEPGTIQMGSWEEYQKQKEEISGIDGGGNDPQPTQIAGDRGNDNVESESSKTESDVNGQGGDRTGSNVDVTP